MPRQPAPLKHLGIVGLRQNSGSIYEEFLPELRWPRAGKIYQQMADNDPVVGSILYLAEMLIRGAQWRVESASDSPADKEAAEFLRQCMDDMEESWASTISEILSMLTYGWSFHEILYKVRRGPKETNPKYHSKFTDGKFGWRGFPIRSQASWDKWVYNDETGELVAFIQRPEPKQHEIVIPIEKGLLFRTRVSRGNPEGKSLLRNAYRPYYFKQRFMVKLRSMAEELVASVRRDANEGIILPAGWELSLLNAPSSRQISIGDVIERYDNRIAITMLSDIVLIGNGSKAGSYAMADVKQSMLANALQAQLYNIADVFNQKAVPQLFDFNNWNLEEYPQIVPGQIATPSLKEVAVMLRAMQLDLNADTELNNYLRSLMAMPQLEGDQPRLQEDAALDGTVDTSFKNQDDTAQKTFEQNEATREVGEEPRNE